MLLAYRKLGLDAAVQPETLVTPTIRMDRIVHGLSLAMLKRGLPHAAMTAGADSGGEGNSAGAAG
jgi:hypothetical protein